MTAAGKLHTGHQFENEKLKTLLANGLSYNLKNGMKVT